MLDALRQRTVAKVLFDEHHGEAWSIRPEAAARMRPSHPAASSYAAAAAELTRRDFAVATTTGRPLDEVALAGADVLVIAHPSDSKWERTVGEDSPVFSPSEIAAVQAFVAAGGGLVVLGEEEEDKYGGNLNELLAPFGVRLEHTIVFEYDPDDGIPSWVVGEAAPDRPTPASCTASGRRGSTAPGRCPPTTPALSCCARAPTPTRPAPRWSPRLATRRVASWSSPTRTSSATTIWASATTGSSGSTSCTGRRWARSAPT